MGNLPNIKVQLEGRTHFFKAKNLKDKLSTELYYLKTTTTNHHHQKNQNQMKKPNQPTNPPSNQPNTHTLKDWEEPGDLTNYEWILLVHLNFYLYSCHSLWFYHYFS